MQDLLLIFVFEYLIALLSATCRARKRLVRVLLIEMRVCVCCSRSAGPPPLFHRGRKFAGHGYYMVSAVDVEVIFLSLNMLNVRI